MRIFPREVSSSDTLHSELKVAVIPYMSEFTRGLISGRDEVFHTIREHLLKWLPLRLREYIYVRSFHTRIEVTDYQLCETLVELWKERKVIHLLVGSGYVTEIQFEFHPARCDSVAVILLVSLWPGENMVAASEPVYYNRWR